jgi:tripartite-type tricarboxylate transporter receptor subunit TctC
MSTHRLLRAAAYLSAALFCQATFSQVFPNKSINVVVPYPAGGASDFVARYMTKEMTATLKQTMLVDNVPGVAGALGTMKVLNAPADGYSMLLTSMNELILTPLVNVNAKYKSEDFKTVAMIGEADIMLVVRKDLEANTVSELITLAKKNTDKPLSYCTSGIGSQFHLIGEKFNAVAGIKTLHAPYAGFPPCVTNLIGQQIDFAFLPVAGPFPGFVDKGQLKILGVTSAKPANHFPKAPLLKSTTGLQDFVFKAWAGLHVSSKTPDDIVLALNKSALAALETEYVKGNIAASGSVRFDLWTPKQAHDYYLNEVATYRAIAKSINLTPQQ